MTLAMSAKAAELKAAGENVISFGVGEPDFATPAHIVQAAKDALDAGYTKYVAAAGLPALKKAVCKKFKEENGLDYEPSQIVISNGAKHSIFNAVFATIDPGDEVIIPSLLAHLPRSGKVLRRRARICHHNQGIGLQNDGRPV